MQSTAADAIRKRVQIRRDLPPPAERRALRVEAGVSQAEMGAAVGATKQAVANWEAGIRTPRGVFLERYVDALRALRDLQAVA
ncbi:helix-turn-helix domain-containing protein [Streptomyces sp. NPDC002405]